MKQTPNLKLFILFISFSIIGYNAFGLVQFSDFSIDEIKDAAGQEGKLYFVNFTAKWCAPCKFMDKYTYTDERLGNFIEENYIAKKLDINSFDGYSLKKEYEVKTLPSVIVFNSKGEMVGKYESSMSAGKMLWILEDHNIPANRVKLPPKPKPEPEVEEPIVEVVKETSTKVIIPQEREIEFTTKGGTTPTALKYRIQVGAFLNKSLLENQSKNLKSLFQSKNATVQSVKGNDAYHRLFIGSFVDFDAAMKFKEELNHAGFEAIVRQVQ